MPRSAHVVSFVFNLHLRKPQSLCAFEYFDHTRFFEIRAELYNPFNRIVFPAIGVGNPLSAATHNSNGLLTGGFGFMNVNNIAAGTARNLLIVARFAF